MVWVMSQRRVDGEYHFYIGAVKIAEIVFCKDAKRWKCFMRLMHSSVGYDLKDYESMSEALRDLHRLLNSPPPERNT